MHLSRTTLLHLVSLVAVRLLVTFMVWSLGFEALSDDDFARVVLSQSFAAAPKLDPTGTSWLPFPFWLHGSLMALFGRSLEVAKTVSVATACGSGLLLYGAARASRVPANAAWVGALAWSFVPVGVYAGAATVPELSTAAMCASALILLRRSDVRSSLLAASLLLPATLSRYEAWPVAMIAIVSFVIRRWERGGEVAATSVAARLAAMALAALGPLAWMTWNHVEHGDALHFHARVSAYFFAAAGKNATDWSALLTYPKAAILDAPVLLVSLAGAAYWTPRRDHLRTWIRPALGSVAAVAALMLAQGTGGAPTHHPERALLLVWAVAWVATADSLFGVGARQGAGWHRWRRIWLACAVAFMLIRTHSVSSWYGVRRTDELAVGGWLRDHADGKILISPVNYGYFAIIAASARPEAVELGTQVDPRLEREPSPFEHAESLLARAKRDDFRWLVARGDHARVAEKVGCRRHERGPWTVVEVTSQSTCSDAPVLTNP